MALLIVFFLLLSPQEKTGPVRTVALTRPAKGVRIPDGVTVADPNITDASVTLTGWERYRVFSLGTNILFATGQIKLQSDNEYQLKKIAAKLKQYPKAPIGIYGNTDSIGTFRHNIKVGRQRAAAVKAWLVNKGGLIPNKITIHSFGEIQPVASNGSARGRRQNRNVVIAVLPI